MTLTYSSTKIGFIISEDGEDSRVGRFTRRTDGKDDTDGTDGKDGNCEIGRCGKQIRVFFLYVSVTLPR